MAHGDGIHGGGSAFDVVLRGYDRRQVDDHLAALEGRLAATSGQCNELRLQRDAAAARVHELEQRLNGAPAVNATSAPTYSAAPAAPAPVSDAARLDGFGARVEAILRLATEEAAAIRASAEDSVRVHAQAEGKLRATFEGIAERLAPLAQRLDQESKAAHEALPAVTSEATSLETAAQQQAERLAEAAAANAARMRADAQARVNLSTRHVADVREELALVTQILTSLGTPSAEDAGGHAAADRTAQPAGNRGPATLRKASTHRSPAGADSPLSPDAPTETIALPLGEQVREGSVSGSGRPAARPSQPPS